MLLKIGKRIINLDNVLAIKRIGDDVRVLFNATASGDFGHAPDYTQFNGDEAAALWNYLTSQAVEIAREKPRETPRPRTCTCGHSEGWHSRDTGQCERGDCQCEIFREQETPSA